jgi:hypothetical protein
VRNETPPPGGLSRGMSRLLEAGAAYFPSLRGRLAAVATATAPNEHLETAADAAGRRGELDVMAELEAISRQSSVVPGASSLSLFRGVRLPDPRGGHKEIDVIAVSHAGICVIEVKNWSGRVRAAAGIGSEAGAWEQLRRGGDVLVHEPPISLLQRKVDLLHGYLAARSVEVEALVGFSVASSCRIVPPLAGCLRGLL